MSEEKPFAVIEESDGMRRLVVGGIEVDSEADYEDGWSVAQSIARGFRADKINAAVEAREARLRGTLAVARDALRLVAECDDHGTIGCEHAECRLNDRSHRFDRETAKAALARLDDPGDYVPRAALVEAEAKVKALQAVTDLLDPRENMTRESVCAYLEANGLKKPEPIDRVTALKTLYQDGPPCPKGCGSLGTPSHATERGRWHGPENATLWCPACGTGWVGSQADVSLAEVAWRAYEALQDMGEA